MGEPLTLWGVGTSRTLRAHWMLAELGLEYERRPVLPRTGETQTEAFLALNPRGKIPVLEHGDLVLAESAAIVTYLGDHFGAQTGLVPRPETLERAHYLEWCFFIMTELDAHTLYVLRRHVDLAALYGEAPVAADAARAYFARQVDVAAKHLGDGRAHLLGDAFTGADILLVSCLDWARFYGLPLPAELLDYRDRVARREGYQRATDINFPPEALAALRSARV